MSCAHRIADTELGDAGLAQLLRNLDGNTSVTYLDLHGTGISSEGGKIFAEVLRSNRTFQTVGLHGNDLRDEGVTAIAEALLTNRTLTSLNLGVNNCAEAGAAAVANGPPMT